MNLLDLVILLILLAGAYRGYRKGFFGSILSIAGTLVGFFCALWLNKPVSLLLDEQFAITEKISPWIANHFHQSFGSVGGSINTGLTQKIAEALQTLKIPGFLKEIVTLGIPQTAVSASAGVQESLQNSVGDAIASLILSIISFAIIFFSVNLVFRIILPKVVHSLTPRPLETIDRIGGLLLGTGAGLIITIFFIIVLTPFLSISALRNPPGFLSVQAENSMLFKFLMSQMGALW